jgi:cephalosporin hydroxylase
MRHYGRAVCDHPSMTIDLELTIPHFLNPSIRQGDTVSTPILEQVKAAAAGKDKVLVTLDSGHDATHVSKEMELYCPLVSVGSYCIVEVCLGFQDVNTD